MEKYNLSESTKNLWKFLFDFNWNNKRISSRF